MSLMKTLTKVAIGVAAAKGIGAVVRNSQQGGRQQAGRGGVFGGQYSNPAQGGGLEDILGGLMGGQRGTAGRAQGGLGGLLDSLGGAQGAARSGTAGGLDDMLGGLMAKVQQGGAGGAAGGLGGLLGGVLGGAVGSAAPQNGAPEASFGELFNQSVQRGGEPEATPTRSQEAAAALLLRAMVQAAKADGEIDAGEQKRLLDRLADSTPEEQELVRAVMQQPVDVNSLVADTPEGMEQHVYMMSVMAIDLDSQAEAQYLDRLANGLGLNQQVVNAIHQQMGVPALYG